MVCTPSGIKRVGHWLAQPVAICTVVKINQSTGWLPSVLSPPLGSWTIDCGVDCKCLSGVYVIRICW